MAICKKMISALLQLGNEDDWLSLRDEPPRLIALSDIAYSEWNPDRTASCLDAIDNGIELPPIKVVGLTIAGQTYYDVSDGNHRSVSAEKRGQQFILADVGGVYELKPERFVIYQKGLWRLNGRYLESQCFRLDDEQLDILIKFGVYQRPDEGRS